MRYIIAKNVGLAWLFNVAFSLALVAVSAASVLWISPAAAGSGVPEVMAYLNGCSLPKARSVRVPHPPAGRLRRTRASCRAPACSEHMVGRIPHERVRVTPPPPRGARRCLSGRRPPSSSSPAPAAWAPGCPSDRRDP
jgi:hypothetical protein